MSKIGTAEGDAADDLSIRAEAEIPAQEFGPLRECRLRDAGDAVRLRGEHEVADPCTAVDGAIDAEVCTGRDHRDVRRAEEPEVLGRLRRARDAVAPRHARRVVEL